MLVQAHSHLTLRRSHLAEQSLHALDNMKRMQALRDEERTRLDSLKKRLEELQQEHIRTEIRVKQMKERVSRLYTSLLRSVDYICRLGDDKWVRI